MNILRLPNRFFIYLALSSIISFDAFAESSLEDADKIIRQYYDGISHVFGATKRGESWSKRNKEVMPLLPDHGNGTFNFPNEPRALFNTGSAPFLEPSNYFGLIDDHKFLTTENNEEKQLLDIMVKVTYGNVVPVSYPITFSDEPSNRVQSVDYYEMDLTKKYSVRDVLDPNWKTVKTVTLHDRISVRKRDGAIASQKNECGGGAGLTADEINFEGLIYEATSAWNRKEYQEAYRLYRKVIELRPDNPPARACFHLGLMMYDQYKKRAVYNPDIDKDTAGKYAVNYMKKGYKMTDEPEFAQECYRAYYNMVNSD